MAYEASPPVSPAGQSRASSDGVDTDNVRNGDNCSWSDSISGTYGIGESRSKRATSKSSEMGGGVVEFCDTKCSECGGTCLRGGFVRGVDNPTNHGPALHIALHSHCGNDCLPFQSTDIKTPNPGLHDLPEEGAGSVSSLGSDDVPNQPEICRYPKWESFCKDTGYSVVPLIGTHPVTSSPIWAAILHHRGLINFGESLAWEVELPTTLVPDTTAIRCNGPVAFVGSKDPDLGFVWVMEEVGAGGRGRLVTVDEIGTEELLGEDIGEAAKRVGWHLQW